MIRLLLSILALTSNVKAVNEQSVESCVKQALKALNTDCSQLTNERDQQVALFAANCLMIEAKISTHKCLDGEAVENCLARLTDEQYVLYEKARTGLKNVCYWVNVEQQRSMPLINVKNFEIFFHNLTKMLKDQKECLEEIQNQQKIVVDTLNNTLDVSKSSKDGSVENLRRVIETNEDVIEIMGALYLKTEEWKNQTSESLKLLVNDFSYVSGVFTHLSSEHFTWSDYLIYGAFCLMIHLLTGNQKTYALRLSLYLSLGLNYLIELILMTLMMSFDFVHPKLMIKIVSVERILYGLFIILFILREYRNLAREKKMIKQKVDQMYSVHQGIYDALQRSNCTIGRKELYK